MIFKKIAAALLITAAFVTAGFSQARERLAILDFTYSGKDSLDTRVVTESFQTELVNVSKRNFSLVERSQINKIIEEQKFNMSGLTESDAIKLGNLAGANKIILGTISLFESKYIINLKVVNTTSGEILFADRVEASDKAGILDVMAILADRVVRKMNGEEVPPFPSIRKGDSVRDAMKEDIRKDSINRDALTREKVSRDDKTIRIKDSDLAVTRDKRDERKDVRALDEKDAKSGMAFEIGLATMTPFYGLDSGGGGLTVALKFPGEGFFQFYTGLDLFGGTLDYSSQSLFYFDLNAGALLNLINTDVFNLGAGAGFVLGFGGIADVIYADGFSQNSVKLQAEAGLKLGKRFMLKLEYAVYLPLGMEMEYPQTAAGYDLYYNAGLAFSIFSIKADFLI